MPFFQKKQGKLKFIWPLEGGVGVGGLLSGYAFGSMLLCLLCHCDFD